MVHRLYVQVYTRFYMMVNSMWSTGRLSMEGGDHSNSVLNAYYIT